MGILRHEEVKLEVNVIDITGWSWALKLGSLTPICAYGYSTTMQTSCKKRVCTSPTDLSIEDKSVSTLSSEYR
jgi:hypothetical protein